MGGVLIEESTARRFSNATRMVENQGIDTRSGQLGRRQPPISGDSYKGYFKAINTSDETGQSIDIVYGYDRDSSYCGYATINDTVFPIDAEEITITGNAFVYLQSIYDINTEITGQPTFEQSASFPAYEANKFKKLICNVVFADSKISDIIQQQYGDIIGQTFGNCE